MNNEIDVNEQQIEDAIDVSLVAILGYLVAISGSLGRARITHFSDRLPFLPRPSPSTMSKPEQLEDGQIYLGESAQLHVTNAESTQCIPL